ncbi:hypothetical protein QBC36DRAFT_371965 [Triangularia setosa]|uniref:Uncharacterized protein n=1 Tax=Triangularia setosa TaxID=2587417 RepID=A0AAN6WA70_9PEZI|nr:hypothetical protein QBC36DRAFT_371965 [Podospora setosa]
MLRVARKRRRGLICGSYAPCSRHPRLAQSSKASLEFWCPWRELACCQCAQCLSTPPSLELAGQFSSNSTFWSNRQTGWSVELFPACPSSVAVAVAFCQLSIGLDWIGFKEAARRSFFCWSSIDSLLKTVSSFLYLQIWWCLPSCLSTLNSTSVRTCSEFRVVTTGSTRVLRLCLTGFIVLNPPPPPRAATNGLYPAGTAQAKVGSLDRDKPSSWYSISRCPR